MELKQELHYLKTFIRVTGNSSFGTVSQSFENKLYFSAQSSNNNTEPWVSDGTSAGTFHV
jgi:hypothetical protein